MNRTLLYVIGGLMLAGIIHITSVLMVPLFATADAWSQMRQFGRDGAFHVLPQARPGAEPLDGLDPRMLYSVCRFSLADGPLQISAALPDSFWSIAVFDRRGRNAYSLNDRAAERSELDLVIITPVQMAQLRQDPPEALETAIVVELPLDTGFALIRVFVSDDTMLPRARAALDSAECSNAI
ncbi:DUF1254 domain-containing protein [Bauldia litoralis]|uniref:Uncharacterized membrane protein n=1 Tax=Bauldia litoralis TaxID=665467 RepID=A0A1G6CEP7_9HYPH|nr:DUF1254 domain-containing protein [Bauldia litoralis]SDB31281.1 Uncharacterized membrane protein [Bauldia litoralis]